MPNPLTAEERSRQFCPSCFADEQSGSWDHVVVAGYCTNCGNASTVLLPEWAIKEIRRCASWVGKRYYPNDEDHERFIERDALLALVKEFPGRTAEREEKNPGYWRVTQRTEKGSIQTSVPAESADEAMRASRLRYVPAAALASSKSDRIKPVAAEGGEDGD